MRLAGNPKSAEPAPHRCPPRVSSLSLPPEIKFVVLLGTDTETQLVGRTDSIMLAFFNRKNGTVSLVEVTRDLYANIPGWNMERINTTYARSGFNLLASTLEYDFGVRPNY